MCNADACVCAPGWVARGTDCVAGEVTKPDARTKAEVCARYAEAKAAPATLYTPPGGGEQCAVGPLPYPSQVAALAYLNFYRWMVGVGPVQVVPNEGQGQQECAKILESTFGHDPPPTAPCYTPLGAASCGNSLIAGGFTAVTQFDGYGMEVEQNLVHRRNILAVGRAGVWVGSTGRSSNMHYGGAYPALASDPAFVAHPGPGIVVRERVPARWFVQKGTASIAAVDARVTEVASGTSKPMKRNHHFNDFSSFDPDGWQPQVDVAYRVELVDDAATVVGSFTTTFVDCP